MCYTACHNCKPGQFYRTFLVKREKNGPKLLTLALEQRVLGSARNLLAVELLWYAVLKVTVKLRYLEVLPVWINSRWTEDPL